MYRGLIDMGPKKWLQQAVYIHFRQRDSKFMKNWQEKEA